MFPGQPNASRSARLCFKDALLSDAVAQDLLPEGGKTCVIRTSEYLVD